MTGNQILSHVPLGPPALDDQAHHWLIANQDGETSEGVCKLCGAHRQFNNAFIWHSPLSIRRPSAEDIALKRELSCCQAAVPVAEAPLGLHQQM